MIFINNWHFVINWFIAFLFLSLICFALAAVLKKPLLKSISLLLFSLFLVLSIVEKYFSATGANYLQSVRHEIFYSKVLAERLRADFVPKRYGGYEIRCTVFADGAFHAYADLNLFLETVEVMYGMGYIMNMQGFRVMPKIDSDNVYIFLGCSFVFGLGVNNNETLPYYFLEKLGRRSAVYNFGIAGRGINAALSIIKNNVLDATVKDKNIEHVFLLILSDTFNRPFRFAHVSDATIFYNGRIFYQQQPLRFLKMLMSSSALHNRFTKSFIDARYKDFYYAISLNIIKEMQKLIKSKYGAKFTVLMWSCALFPHKQQKKIMSFFEENNIDFICLKETLEPLGDWSRLYSRHPSAQAHQAVAHALFEHIYGDRDCR